MLFCLCFGVPAWRLIFIYFIFVVSTCRLVLFSYSCWSFVDVPLIFSFLIQQNTYYRVVVPDWQQKLIILLGMVEALSDDYVKHTHTHTHTRAGLRGYVQFNKYTHTHTINTHTSPVGRINASGIE